MKTKSFILLLAGIILLGGAIAGAFFGGEAVGKRNERATLTQTAQNRIGQFGNTTRPQGGAIGGGGGMVPGGGPGLPGVGGLIGGGGFGGGTIGTVQNVQGNIVTLTAQNGSAVTVTLSANTTIEKISQGKPGDITTGSNITVGGQRNNDGSIQATTILLNQPAIH